MAGGEGADAFLYRLFVAIHAAAFAPLGLPAAQLDALLRMQHAARARGYATAFPGLETMLLREDGVPVGALLTAETPDAIRLVDIAILPGHQGRGLGTEAIQALKTRAVGRGKPIDLHVARANPRAHALYARLGFRVRGEVPPDVAMRWTP